MGKDTLKVGIVGSRKYENRQKIKEFIFKLKNDKGKDTVIVSGGCTKGADYYAKKYALELGYNMKNIHQHIRHIIYIVHYMKEIMESHIMFLIFLREINRLQYIQNML